MRGLKARDLVTILCFTIGSQAAGHDTVDDFENRVIDVILDRPEVVFAALKVLERTKLEEERAKERQRIALSADTLFAIEGPGNLSPETEPLLIEFFDYRCPYCAQSVSITENFAEKHDRRVRLVEFPILGEESEAISKFALGVRNVHGLDAYNTFRVAMFAQEGRPKTEGTAKFLIEELGYDLDQVVQVSLGDAVQDELDRNKRLALALGINGTPAYVGQFGLGGGMQTIEQLEEISGVGE